MKKIKILFQGDSITDAGRDKRNYHDMGPGYPHYASEQIKLDFPNTELEFINLGISGTRSGQLLDRAYRDIILIDADIISVLIGINDIWHRYGADKVDTSDERIALHYRTLMSKLKTETNAKIVAISPYVLDAPDKVQIKSDLDNILPMIKEVAKEYADVYIPLDELFAEAIKTQPQPMYYSADGIHPNDNGARFIGKHYAEAIKPILQSL